MDVGQLSKLQRQFRFFADMCEEQSPLYSTLSARVADEPLILRIAGIGQKGQPPVNLLFGAVHFMLLGGVRHPLREFYPSVGGERDPRQAWLHLVDFCRNYRAELEAQVVKRRIQTNEVGRCGLLLPAFARVYSKVDRPLHLIEVGASAGLNLLFDRYHYAYDNGARCGSESAPLTINVQVRGDASAFGSLNDFPPIRGRVGIDIAPADVTDDECMRWIESLIWPDDMDRIERHRAARLVARQTPPTILAGDALECLSTMIADVPADVIPCVYHSHVTYQMTDAWREQFDALLDSIGQSRPLAHVSIEWLKDDPGPKLDAQVWRHGERRRVMHADCHHHGRWMSINDHMRPFGAES